MSIQDYGRWFLRDGRETGCGCCRCRCEGGDGPAIRRSGTAVPELRLDGDLGAAVAVDVGRAGGRGGEVSLDAVEEGVAWGRFVGFR